tara:strand:+ start:682 stop:1707 length:1026 start_codon:yes stop_codon:yes gene_type:complete
MNTMMGIIRWLNPAYPIIKLLSPVLRRPEKVLAVGAKPFASASSALMERNKETIALQLTGDVEGDVVITVPYDQNTLEKILAISLIPQVALLSTAYSIPELQRDLNTIWNTATLGKAGNLPRWKYSRDLLGRRIKQEVAKEVAEKATAKALAQGVAPKVATQLGARAGGSFIAGLNVVIWVDTAILATTGILDLLIDEGLEEDLGINITPYSPLGEVIGGLMGWVGNVLGITDNDIVAVGEAVGLDALAQGSLFLFGDLVVDTANITIESDITVMDQNIVLDLDARTFGETAGLALQFGAMDATIGGGWDDPAELMTLFLSVFFSIVLIRLAKGFFNILRK